MSDRPVTLVQPDGSESVDESVEEVELAHERLEVYKVLELAYRTGTSWQGVSWSRGTTGDQLRRALSGAVLRYTEGYYADGGNKTSLWKSARASCGEASAAIQLLAIDSAGAGGGGCACACAPRSRHADACTLATSALNADVDVDALTLTP